MSTYLRPGVAILFTFLLGALALGPARGEEASLEELLTEIRTLHARLERLEQRFDALEQALNETPPATSQDSRQLENEARSAYAEMVNLVAQGESAQAREKMADFNRQYGATRTASLARRLQRELDVVGKPRPDSWEIQMWLQGEDEVSLDRDGVTLLVFWEVWCPHCRREAPRIQQLYADWKGSGLQVVGLMKMDKGTSEEGVRSFLDEQGITYPIARQDGALSLYFNVFSIPAAALLKDGVVIWRGHPGRLSEDLLKSFL